MIDMEVYNPTMHGLVTAIRIFNEDGYKPMAELIFAFGGSRIIRWDIVENREEYAAGINAYTLMYDERAKRPFDELRVEALNKGEEG